MCTITDFYHTNCNELHGSKTKIIEKLNKKLCRLNSYIKFNEQHYIPYYNLKLCV